MRFKALIIGLFVLMVVVELTSADCVVCNETCSPCGGGCTVTSLASMFLGVTDWTSVGDITGWDTSCITNFDYLFKFSNFNQSIGAWNTSSVTRMVEVFRGSPFNQDIGGWDVRKVTTFSGRLQIWGGYFVGQRHLIMI